MVDASAATNPAGERPALRRVPHRLAAGWHGVGSVADSIMLDHPLASLREWIGPTTLGGGGVLERRPLEFPGFPAPSAAPDPSPPITPARWIPGPAHRITLRLGAVLWRVNAAGWTGMVFVGRGMVRWASRLGAGLSRRLPPAWRKRWNHEPRQIHWNRKTP